MKVYGHPLSTCTRKVLATLAEKGQKAEFVLVDILAGAGKSPEHLARQPFGQIPVLEDDGFMMYESRAICRYLDEVLPGEKVLPHDPKARAAVEQWISVEASNFTPTAMIIIVETVFTKMRGAEPDAAKVEAARQKLGTTLDIMEKQLSGNSFIAGSHFSLADICYLPYIEYLFFGGQGDLITSRPHVSAWWTRCSERPSWKIATGKN
jgi:glutathione S-transferase